MFRILVLLASCGSAASLVPRGDTRAAEPKPPVRGVLIEPGRITPAFLASWKSGGATATGPSVTFRSGYQWRA